MRQRKVILFDDWSKGANTHDKLLPEGVSAQVENFSCMRAGMLEKVPPPFEIDIPTSEPWTHHINKVFYYYMNNKTYLVVLADLAYDAMIAIHDGTSWDSFKATDGYFKNTTGISSLLDVIFVSSTVGGKPHLRCYPQYPSTVDAEWWVPLRIFFNEEISVSRIQTIDDVEHATYPTLRYTGTLIGGNKIQCACKNRAGLGSPGIYDTLQPCKTAGTYYTTGCLGSWQPERIDFTAHYSQGDVLLIGYKDGGSGTDRIWMAAEVLNVTSSEVTISKQIQVSPAHDPLIAYAQMEVSKMLRVDTASSVTTQVEEVLCVRGNAPVIPTSDVDGGGTTKVTYYCDTDHTSQCSIPVDYYDCEYEGRDIIDYGFAFRMLDGQIGPMTVHRYEISADSFVDQASAGATGFVILSISNSIFPSTVTGNKAENSLAKAVQDLVVFRKNDDDEEWKVLGVLERVDETDNSDWVHETDADFSPSSAYLGSNKMTSIRLGLSARLFHASIIDCGQTLSENVFSFSGGVEEEDLGVEIGCRAPAVYGKKIYAGNVLEINRGDSSWDAEWKDDTIYPSLFDKGEMFNREEFLDVTEGESDSIVKIVFFGRQMLVYKQNKVVVVEILGTSEGSWRHVTTIKNGVKYYFHVCETPYGPCWLSPNGIHIWTGEQMVTLSQAFDRDYRDWYHTASNYEYLRIGFDQNTSKLHVVCEWWDDDWVISMNTGALMTVDMSSGLFRWRTLGNDLSGRLFGVRFSSRLPFYLEARDDELVSGEWTIGSGIWESGEFDLASMVGDAKLKVLYFYFSYKRETGYAGTHNLNITVTIDGTALTTKTIVLPAGVQEATRIGEVEVWSHGQVMNIKLDTNEAAEQFDYFRLWKVAASFDERNLR